MQLQKEVKKEPNAKISIRVTVGSEAVRESRDEILKDFEKKAKVPGFRKGKVPKNVVLSRFGSSIKEETIQRVLTRSLEQIIKEDNYRPISEPLVVEMGDLLPDQDFSYRAEFDVVPEVKLGEYRGIKAEKYIYEVGDEQVEKELELLRERFGSLVSTEESAELGLYVVLDYEELDAQSKVRGGKKDQTVLLNDKDDELTKQLLRVKKGDEKTVSLTYKEKQGEQERETQFKLRITVKDVKKKVLPELNDDFAQDISDVQSIDELRKKVRSELEKEAARLSDEKNRDELIKKLIESSDIELPESMVSSETDRMLYSIGEAYRIDLEKLRKDGKRLKEYRDNLRPRAVNNVKYELIMNEIARTEGIEAADQDIENELKKYAEARKKDLESVKKTAAENKSLENIRYRIRQNKARDFVVANAQFEKVNKLRLDAVRLDAVRLGADGGKA